MASNWLLHSNLGGSRGAAPSPPIQSLNYRFLHASFSTIFACTAEVPPVTNSWIRHCLQDFLHFSYLQNVLETDVIYINIILHLHILYLCQIQGVGQSNDTFQSVDLTCCVTHQVAVKGNAASTPSSSSFQTLLGPYPS